MKLLMLEAESAGVNEDREDTVEAIAISGFREMAAKLGGIEEYSATYSATPPFLNTVHDHVTLYHPDDNPDGILEGLRWDDYVIIRL
jgi:hypothetical protein